MIMIIAAILAYEDLRLRYLASFLYFCDNVERLLALSSNAEDKKLELGVYTGIKRYQFPELVVLLVVAT